LSIQTNHISTRYTQFWSSLKSAKLSFYLLCGWLVSLLFLIINLVYADNEYFYIFIGIFIFFFFKLLDNIYKHLRLPVELLLILLQLVFCIIYVVLHHIFKSAALVPPNYKFWTIVYAPVLGFALLLLGLIFMVNSGGKKTGFVKLTLLGFLGQQILLTDNFYYTLFLQAILFLIILQFTKWLEELKKAECYVYFILSVIFFNFISLCHPFTAFQPSQFEHLHLWYTIPYYLYLIFRIYVLAIIIKIPIVLVYNHASLSRKLKISGLFQSTFPQLIQFIMLVIIFYSFLSGWQAEHLRQSVQKLIDHVQSGNVSLPLTHVKMLMNEQQNFIKLNGYEKFQNPDQLPRCGVLPLRNLTVPEDSAAVDYFLFSKKMHSAGEELYLVKIDTMFLHAVSEKLRFLAGTSLNAYPCSPGKWSSYFYRSNFWQRDRYVKIFPLAFLSENNKTATAVSLTESMEIESDLQSNLITLFSSEKLNLIFGRVFINIWEPRTATMKPSRPNYLAFDLLLNINPGLLWSGLPQIILILILIYFLINAFLIRRVVKFGSQINEMIIQKFNYLKRGINQIAAGNLDHKIQLEGNDEFVELAGRFNEMGDRLKLTMAEMREKERLEYEMQIARQVQLSLLPRKLPVKAGLKISASLKTATEVGGDFYDILSLDDNRFLFSIGDVSGKGSSAAFYMAQFMSLIRYTRQFTIDPLEMCSRLNDYFASPLVDKQIYVTAIFGIVDLAENTLQLVRAGHTESIFLPGDISKKIIIPSSGGLGIGLTKNTEIFQKSLKSITIGFHPGDTLLSYTDGVIEAMRMLQQKTEQEISTVDMYGEERLLRLLQKIRTKSADDIIKEIELDIDAFYDGFPRVDDHTLLIIQRTSDS